MKKIFFALFILLLSSISITFGAPQSSDQFSQVCPLPGNLPTGWQFTQESDKGFQIYYPGNNDKIRIGVAQVKGEDFQKLSPKEARDYFIQNTKLTEDSSVTYTNQENTYSGTHTFGVLLQNKGTNSGPYVSIDFFLYKSILYTTIITHPSSLDKHKSIRTQLYQSILRPTK